MKGGFETRNGKLNNPSEKPRRKMIYETFKAPRPCSCFLLFLSIAKDLLQLKAKVTPKTHLRIAPETSLPREGWVGKNFFAFRLPSCKSCFHGTLLQRTLLLACVPGSSFSGDLSCVCFEAVKREGKKWISSQSDTEYPWSKFMYIIPLLSSALWRLPGNLIDSGKILHYHMSFAGFWMTAAERGQIYY